MNNKRLSLLLVLVIVSSKMSLAQANILQNTGFEDQAIFNEYPSGTPASQFGINHPILDKWLSDEAPNGVPAKHNDVFHLSSQINLLVGMNTCNLFSNKYTPDSSASSGLDFTGEPTELFRFKYVVNVSSEIYGVYKLNIGKLPFAETGIGLCRRSFKIKRTIQSYSTIAYDNLIGTIGINNIVEFPLSIGINIKHFSVSGGFLFPLINISSSRLIYKDGFIQRTNNNFQFIGDNLIIRSFLKISGDLALKKKYIGMYLAVDRPTSRLPYIHFGLQVSFSHK